MKTSIVTVGQGQVKGKTLNNYLGEEFYSFQGIPYAKAPLGDLRFCPPEPAEPWTGVYDATHEGPECPSLHMLIPMIVGNEDNCLNLNIYTKHLPSESSKLRPVMFWIHGGGFVRGSNKADLYGPSFLMMEDIVLVAINYRLGPFGFLCLEDSSLGVTGNQGLKDQIMALKWVRDNIKAFNGDPDNVTIFGESAGGASVHFLILSSLTKGLFHKAILQSGCAFNPWADGSQGAEDLCKLLGYNETDDKKVLEFLRRVPSKKIANTAIRMRDALRANERRLFGVVIEKPSPDAVISDTPENIIKSGNYNKVPMIIGCTNREGYIFELVRRINPYAEYPVRDFCKEIDFHYNLPTDEKKRQDLGNRIKKFYFGSEDADVNNMEHTIDLKSDNMFIYGIKKGIKLHISTTQEPIYAYVMTLDAKLNFCKKLFTATWFKSHAFLSVMLSKYNGYFKPYLATVRDWFSHVKEELKGASHGDDLMYLFTSGMHGKIEPGSIEENSIKRFVKLWTNFAEHGNPTPDANDSLLNVTWKPTDKELTYLELGHKLELKSNPFKERIEFWDTLYSELTLRTE